ncbi:hypothetical protein C8A01DRAFT_36318 [Parachaetomium inaequale]|uniref:Uncharacterized protein n=1 Tax=Parachaetomium inaequale TaxID=2588326 RepID=A0AAN6SRK1_9PEZI|nr:hypothetical protein C8A01DRAFT_36318 [Parachaetomium inaequale]
MQLNTASLVAAALAFAATASADSLIVHQYCLTLACNNPGTWHSAYGDFFVDAGEGCRDPDIPGMWSLCIDEGNARGHFYFDNQPKRCIKQTDNDFEKCSDDYQFATCSVIYYDEVPCTW